ncbi:MAG: GGDEF domain-containing protein [Pseudomonadota bacterium]
MTTNISESQAIDNLTRQTDYRGLCAHLIASLTSLLEAEVKLYEAHDEDGNLDIERLEKSKTVFREFPLTDNLPHPSWLNDLFDHLNDDARLANTVYNNSDITLMSLGCLNGVWRMLFVDTLIDAEQADSLKYVVKIFINMLRLLDRFERDALTGLLNRQSFDYRFEDLLEHHQRNPKRTVKDDAISWLAIIDIDRFKLINDTHGHLFGDEILLVTARLIQNCFRFDDLVFRYGGEEFIIILNNTDSAGAALALERLRKTVEGHDFPTVDQVTVSIGWSSVTPNVPANSIIHRADRALYHAKSLGRNRTIKFEDHFQEAEPATNTDVRLFTPKN